MFNTSDYRNLERCVICKERFSKEESRRAVIVGTGPTKFAHKKCRDMKKKKPITEAYISY